MTDQEILEGQKLIASMRGDLSLIAGTTDIEKLIALVLEKKSRLDDDFLQLVELAQPWIRASLDVSHDMESIQNAIVTITTYAQLASSRPDCRAELTKAVTYWAPVVNSTLGKVEILVRPK
jgi:hypothetical protein